MYQNLNMTPSYRIYKLKKLPTQNEIGILNMFVDDTFLYHGSLYKFSTHQY